MTKLSIAVAAACVAGAAFADKVVLKSGSFLTGETGAISGDALKFKSDDLGDMEIKLEKIQSIDKAKNHVVQYLDGTKAERILVVRDGKIIEQGRHDELMRRRGHYYRLYTRQYEDEATSALLA